ncbi:MAG: TIGR04219 family outer membrane beta-barrel protein [Proteobacteria bacterium]|nr:TIGR04219 family outer membrane beta-barrel protein [Pseudomonadota bacterium]
MKIKQLFCLLAVALPLSANADFLSISAGGGGWNADPSGNFQQTIDAAAGEAPVDVKNDLFWNSKTQGYAFITLEHFVPIVPNARLMLTNIDQSGSGTADFTFDGDNYTGNVSNDFSIQTLDLLLYYEVLDNIVSLDLGLNIRNLKVDYTITGTVAGTPTTTTDSLDETVPMLYVLVGASPWPELIISGELSYVAYSGSSISDFTAKVAYTTNFFVGFEAGYRMQQYEFDDVSETDAKLDFDGVFAGAYLKF